MSKIMKLIIRITPFTLTFIFFLVRISSYRNTYEFSLQSIALVIKFFQGKKVFDQTNNIFSKSNSTLSNVKEFKFIVNLYTPTFEKRNFVWGTLGGNNFPRQFIKFH
ncbi:hypothetical protein [Abyssalbus ytuae]|uniref:hypothetical protein n=1 Tax=Abyssalbus ytuae TaxID=2926907 RepID=UPI0034E2C8C1